MAIDYQQILMDMNRPRRRANNAGRRYLTLFVFLLVLAGCGYAVWQYNLVGKAYDAGHGLVARYWPGSGSGQNQDGNGGGATALAALDQSLFDSQQHADQRDVTLSPITIPSPAAQAGVAALPATGPIDVALAGNSTPRSVQPATSASQLAMAGTVAPTRQPASAVQTAPASFNRAQGNASPAAPAATPVLSEAREQMKAVDQMLTTDPAEALRRMESLLRTDLQPDEAAEAAYRLGYAARMLQDVEKAQTVWKTAAERWPESRGGRFSALALADMWYRQYAGDRPQMSHWDDIQALYSQVLGKDDAPFLPAQVKSAVKANLTRLNDSVFFGTAPTKMARYHKVEQGELLGSIASRYRVDYESIARINGINPNRIRSGMDLKLVVGDVSVVVRKNSRDPNAGPTVTWYLDDRWVREYPACVGDGNKTPAGTYTLTSKEKDPSWTNPANGQLLPNTHPENILGSRWMAMRGMNTQGLGIHGTTVDDSIPGYTSAGCVRLLNRDVEELFSYARIGGTVTVLE